jgi:arylsulfatase
LLAGLALAGACLAAAVRAEEPRPLNVLVLFADDWRHDVLGAAGHPVVQTPRLDRLAAEGVRFTQCRVTTSICGVSRASLFTGQWMSRHGCRGFNMFSTPWEQTYPGKLRSHGYHVGHIGKWHNGDFPAGRFDFGRSYHVRHWHEIPGRGLVHVTRRNQEDALEFLRSRPADQPFCLTVAFFATHAEDGHPQQFLPQPESFELYQNTPIPLPATATEEAWKRLPPFFNEQNEGRNRWRWRFDSPGKYQEMMRNYYRLATEVDHTCGVLLDELARQNLLENTLVLFTTDNGYFHGEHGLADKWYPHEESIRVPLILRDPRLPAGSRGRSLNPLVLNTDLAPTLLAAAGIDAPATMQGENLAPLYLRPDPPAWREDFFYEHPTIRNARFIPSSEALVSREWKYFFWPEHDYEQLFHLATDPGEQNDLARDPAHAARLESMRSRFAQLKAAAR